MTRAMIFSRDVFQMRSVRSRGCCHSGSDRHVSMLNSEPPKVNMGMSRREACDALLMLKAQNAELLRDSAWFRAFISLEPRSYEYEVTDALNLRSVAAAAFSCRMRSRSASQAQMSETSYRE